MFLSVFIIDNNHIGFCQMIFLHVWRWYFWSFTLLFWCITLADYILYVEPTTLHSWGKSHLVGVCNPFYMFLDLVCLCFIDSFCNSVYKVYWFIVFLFCLFVLTDIFVWFSHQGTTGLRWQLVKCSSYLKKKFVGACY